MAQSDFEAQREAVAGALAGALGELVTGWVVVVETLTDEGEQACWTLTQPGQPEWRTLGLIAWADRADDRGADS